jgi:hypothetical protein
MKKLMLAAVLAISVLPGCGKKNNDAGNVNTGVAPVGVSSIGIQSGSCYNMNQVAVNGAVNLTFQGQGFVSPYTGALQAQLQGVNVAFPGVSYSRTNAAGDTLQVYVSGQNVIAYASLAANTVNWIRYYGGNQGSMICGIYINSPVSGSTLTMSAQIIGGYGSAYQITL